jgi:hypothetical protein
VGDFGEWVEEELDRFTDMEYNFYCCYYYDAFLSISYVLDWGISQGKEFENWKVFREIFTETRFTG